MWSAIYISQQTGANSYDLSFKITTFVRVQMLGHFVNDENLLPQEFGDRFSFLV